MNKTPLHGQRFKKIARSLHELTNYQIAPIVQQCSTPYQNYPTQEQQLKPHSYIMKNATRIRLYTYCLTGLYMMLTQPVALACQEPTVIFVAPHSIAVNLEALTTASAPDTTLYTPVAYQHKPPIYVVPGTLVHNMHYVNTVSKKIPQTCNAQPQASILQNTTAQDTAISEKNVQHQTPTKQHSLLPAGKYPSPHSHLKQLCASMICPSTEHNSKKKPQATAHHLAQGDTTAFPSNKNTAYHTIQHNPSFVRYVFSLPPPTATAV